MARELLQSSTAAADKECMNTLALNIRRQHHPTTYTNIPCYSALGRRSLPTKHSTYLTYHTRMTPIVTSNPVCYAGDHHRLTRPHSGEGRGGGVTDGPQADAAAQHARAPRLRPVRMYVCTYVSIIRSGEQT